MPPYTVGQSRLDRFASHLSKAKEEAKAVPADVDLGIHNPGDPQYLFLQRPLVIFLVSIIHETFVRVSMSAVQARAISKEVFLVESNSLCLLVLRDISLCLLLLYSVFRFF